MPSEPFPLPLPSKAGPSVSGRHGHGAALLCCRHMVLLKEQYGKQVVVNLLGSRGGEEVLNRAFKVNIWDMCLWWMGAGSRGPCSPEAGSLAGWGGWLEAILQISPSLGGLSSPELQHQATWAPDLMAGRICSESKQVPLSPAAFPAEPPTGWTCTHTPIRLRTSVWASPTHP